MQAGVQAPAHTPGPEPCCTHGITGEETSSVLQGLDFHYFKGKIHLDSGRGKGIAEGYSGKQLVSRRPSEASSICRETMYNFLCCVVFIFTF